MRLIAAVLLALLAVGISPAWAEDRQGAKEAYKRAIQDYNLGEYRQALDGFKLAYRNFEEPTFLFNIGQCHRMLGENLEALRAFRAYLREAKETGNRADVEKLIVSLETLVREQNNSRATPPQGTITPTVHTTEPSPAPAALPPVVVAQPSAPVATPTRSEKTPAYKKWWVWTLVVVAVAGAGVGLGVGLTRSPTDKYPTSNTAATDGSFHF